MSKERRASIEYAYGRKGSFYLNGDRSGSMVQLNAERLEILQEMRPVKLVGVYEKIVDWSGKLVDTVRVRNRKLKQFYEDQNCLIERYQEIDKLLDSGIHVSMLENYSSDILTSIQEHEEATNADFYHDVNDAANYQAISSKMATRNDRRTGVPGNIDTEGAPLLGYNKDEEESEVAFAILVNFFVNFVLLVGKIVVAIMTSSISIIASLVDSVLDFLSTTIIYISNRLSTAKDWKTRDLYPVGRSRLEPLGVLIFSIIIILSFFQVAQEAFKKLFFSINKETVEIGISAMVIMTLTIVAKVGCWLWCRSSKSSSVQALAQDAMTDIVFNTFSIIMPLLGHRFDIWWFDPLGALLLCIYVIVQWGYIAFEHIDNLTGASGDLEDQKVILYLCTRFAACIKQVTNLSVYHVGDNLNVEVDLVLDPKLSLRDAHDIGEALQYAIETLPMVERAFVHLDYRAGNYSGHIG